LSLRAARSFYLYLCRRLRLPPPPSPFPYTTLFRSGHHVRAPRLHVDQREAPVVRREAVGVHRAVHVVHTARRGQDGPRRDVLRQDRKSTRLNSSHVKISYAVFCLKKKKTKHATGKS